MTLTTRSFLIIRLLSARSKACGSRDTSRIAQISISILSQRYSVHNPYIKAFIPIVKGPPFFVIDPALPKINRPKSTLVITKNHPRRMPLKCTKMRKLSIQRITISLSWLHHFASISSRKDIGKTEAVLWRLMSYTARNSINLLILPWNPHEIVVMSHYFIQILLNHYS